MANDPVLEGAAGVTYKNPLTDQVMAQPGKHEKTRVTALFMHRTHESFHPGNAIDQLQPNIGQQILLHRISKYNEDGTAAEGVDLLYNIIDTGVVPFDDAKQANKVFGEPADPNATDLVIYACSGANGEPGLATHRTYARARLVVPAAPIQG